MSKPHPHDISIGKDRWITFIELDGRQAEALDIDSVLEPIESFLGLLESECVVACCGIDALGLWAQGIARDQRECQDPDIGNKVAAVRNRVAHSGSTTLVSHTLTNYFDQHVLVAVLDHIEVCLATSNGFAIKTRLDHIFTTSQYPMDVVDQLSAKVRRARLSLHPPIQLLEVERFEADAGIGIPDDYRAFLLRVANGGWGSCRLVALEDWSASYWIDDPRPELVAQPCLVTPEAERRGQHWLEELGVPDWEARWDRGEWSPMLGTIAVAEIGCGLFFSMVMNGQYRGRIFSWGDHALIPPYFCPFNGFGEWFESCLGMILAGRPVHFLDGRVV